MSVLEKEIRKTILEINYYVVNQNKDYMFKSKAKQLIADVYTRISENLVDHLTHMSIDMLIELSEASLPLGDCTEITEGFLNIYFDQESSKNNYHIRGLLVKAQIEARKAHFKQLKAEEMITALKSAVAYILKAVEIIAKPENKQKYAGLVYNASICCYNILKSYYKPNFAKHFWDVMEKISMLLEELDDVDFNWRIRFLLKLAQCDIDAEKKAEGTKALDKITDILKKKGECDFHEELYRYRIHLSRDNNGALGNLKKEGEALPESRGFRYIYILQCIKSGVIPDNQMDKEIQAFLNLILPDFNKIVNDHGINFKLDVKKGDLLAEAGFLFIRGKFYTYAQQVYDVLQRVRACTLKGKLYLENIRAQLYINKFESEIKTNSFNEQEIRDKRIEVRTEALKILERNLSGCERIMDLDLINETCYMIWNMGLPFVKPSLRKHFSKAFDAAVDLMEHVESNEHYLRALMHFELAKFNLESDLLQEADKHLIKALTFDYSIPIGKINAKPGEHIAYLQRNLEQYLVYLKRSVGTRLDIYKERDNIIDRVIFELDTIKNSKHDEARVEIIQKCADLIKLYTPLDFSYDESKDLVEEEINELKAKHELKVYEDKKHFTNSCVELAKLAYQFDSYSAVIDINNKLKEFEHTWNVTKDVDQIIALAECNIVASQCYNEYLLNESIEVGSQEVVNFNDNTKTFDDGEKERYSQWKQLLLNHIKEAVRLAVSVQQYWLVFNCAIQLWNMYLPIFQTPDFQKMVNENIIPVLTDLFEGLNTGTIFYESINADQYDSDYFNRVDLFVDISDIYARLLEAKGRPDESIRICDTMLLRRLKSHHRKRFDTIKSRASRANDGKKVQAPKTTSNNKLKDKKDQIVVTNTFSSEQVAVSECFANVEAASLSKDDKTKLDYLKKGYDILKNIKVNKHDESFCEIYAELWYKYGIQYFQMNSNVCYKVALSCADFCVKLHTDDNISRDLQKWYSVGYLLYSDCLYKLIDKDRQERESQIQLVLTAVDKLIKSAKLAERAKNYFIILQTLRAMYSLIILIIEQPQCRVDLVKRFLDMHKFVATNRVSVIYSDSEFMLLLYTLFFHCINEKKDWELGEQIVMDSFKIIPNSLHHFLQEHKFFYFSKLGKNFMENLSSVDDKDVTTKAKMYVKLARSSTLKADQHNSYLKAIEILKADENILLTDVLCETASWLYKNNYPVEEVEEYYLQAADIFLEIEPVFEDDEALDDESNTLHSKRSTSSRRSRLSKRSKSKKTVNRQSIQNTKAKNTKASNRTLKSRVYSVQTAKTKTVFGSNVDVDYYPIYLTVSHFEQLFKIHVSLAITTNDSKKKQDYLLDAFFFLNKIMEASLKTLNCLEYWEKNKEELNKFATVDKDGNSINPLQSLINNYYTTKELNIPVVHSMPDSLDGWIFYNVPEFFQKQSKEFQDRNFFSKKAFDKPYQFHYYLMYIIDKFINEYFFHSQSIFLLRFGLLYSDLILNNHDLKNSLLLTQKRLYMNIIIDQGVIPGGVFDIQTLGLTADKKNKEREELKKLDIKLNTDGGFLNDTTNNTILIVDDLKIHITWIDLAKELFKFGYYNLAKEYLEESIFHCLVLKDKVNYLRANIILSEILFIEADFNAAFNLLNSLQGINTNPEFYFEILVNICNILFYMKKYDDLMFYIEQTIDYYTQLGHTMHKTINHSILSNILSYALLYDCRLRMKKVNHLTSVKQISEYYDDQIAPKLKKYNQIADKAGMSLHNVELQMKYIEISVETLFSSNLLVYITEEDIQLALTILNNVMEMLIAIQTYVSNLQTYIPARIDNSIIYLPIHRFISVIKIRIAGVNNTIGEYKRKLQKKDKKRKLESEAKARQNSGVDYNEKVIEFLDLMTKEILKDELMINSHEFSQFEKSIVILNSCESLINKDSVEYVNYYIEKINSLRLHAAGKKELKTLWSNELLQTIRDAQMNTTLSTITENEVYKVQVFHQQALNLISVFEKIILEKPILFNSIFTTVSRENLKYFYNVLECSGYLNIELSFKSVCDYQHQMTKFLYKDVISKFLHFSTRDWVVRTGLENAKKNFNALVNSLNYPESIENMSKSFAELNYNKFITNNPNWVEIKNILPTSTCYFVFQMTEDRSTLFLGLLVINLERKPEYYLKKIPISSGINRRLDENIEIIHRLKHTMMKSVIATKEELIKLQEEYNVLMKEVLEYLEKEFKVYWLDLDKIINPEIKIDEHADKKNIKTTKPTTGTKKDNKQPELILPTSNIEAVTFLIDHRFYELPFDNIAVFENIPFKSNDLSMKTLVTRLQHINFNPLTSSYCTVDKSSFKYYLDYHKENCKKDIKSVIDSKLSIASGKNDIKPEGIVSYDHYPSIPELQKLYSSSSIFAFTSQTSILFQYPPHELLDNSKFTKCKLGIVLDRTATVKNYVEQKSLIQTSFQFGDQPLDVIVLLTLSGLSGIVTTRWSLDFDENAELLEDILDECIKGNPVSKGISKYILPKKIVEGGGVLSEGGKGKGKKDISSKTIPVVETVVEKKEIFQFAPVLFGLNCLKFN
jgi:hypothetical protein